MKKFLFLMLAAVLLGMTAGMSSCESCGKGEPQEPIVDNETAVAGDYDGLVQNFTAGVAHIQALHRQTMYSMGVANYQWRNSKVLFNDTISFENIGELYVVDVTDVFQYYDKGAKVQFISSNIEKGTIVAPPIPGVWIEDASLNEAPIILSAEDVLVRLCEWDGIIPPASGMSLRLPVGPVECNAQWVIGNAYDVIFIDAVTGDITDWCPAFPRD